VRTTSRSATWSLPGRSTITRHCSPSGPAAPASCPAKKWRTLHGVDLGQEPPRRCRRIEALAARVLDAPGDVLFAITIRAPFWADRAQRGSERGIGVGHSADRLQTRSHVVVTCPRRATHRLLERSRRARRSANQTIRSTRVIVGGSTRRRMRPMISGSVVVGRRDPSHRTNLPRERLGPACLRLWRCPFSPSGDVFREEALLGQATVATRRGQSPTFTTSH
jgi:hypothetical protein